MSPTKERCEFCGWTPAHGTITAEACCMSRITANLRAENARLVERVETLEKTLRGYHKVANSLPYAQWTPEMHRAESALASPTEAEGEGPRRIEFTQEWCMAAAESEGDCDPTTGAPNTTVEAGDNE